MKPARHCHEAQTAGLPLCETTTVSELTSLNRKFNPSTP